MAVAQDLGFPEIKCLNCGKRVRTERVAPRRSAREVKARQRAYMRNYMREYNRRKRARHGTVAA